MCFVLFNRSAGCTPFAACIIVNYFSKVRMHWVNVVIMYPVVLLVPVSWSIKSLYVITNFKKQKVKWLDIIDRRYPPYIVDHTKAQSQI